MLLTRENYDCLTTNGLDVCSYIISMEPRGLLGTSTRQEFITVPGGTDPPRTNCVKEENDTCTQKAQLMC